MAGVGTPAGPPAAAQPFEPQIEHEVPNEHCGPATTAGVGDVSTPGAPRPDREAIPQMEVLSDGEMKRLFRVVYSTVLVGTALLSVLFGMKMSSRFDHSDKTWPASVVGAAIAAFDAAILTACLAVFARRLAAVRRAGLTWSPRRWRWTVIFLAQLGCVYLGNLFFLIPRLHATARDCGFIHPLNGYSSVVRWTAWNTLLALFVVHARGLNLMVDAKGEFIAGCEGALWLDAPWRAHWFIFVYWGLYQGFVLHCLTISIQTSPVMCASAAALCPLPQDIALSINLMIAMSVGYLSMFLYFMRRAFVLFAERSYVSYRWENISLRLTFRMVGIILLFGVLSIALLGLVRMDSCLSFVLVMGGYIPMQLALALLMVVNTILVLPVKPGCQRPLRALPVVPLWMEKGIKESPEDDLEGGTNSHPVFCFETAVKLLYWCEYIYEHDPRNQQGTFPWDLQTGLSLYSFKHFEYLTAKEMDVHGMIAWSAAGTILLCFRGTYSATNVWADIKVWRTTHPPERGLFWLGTRPLVHRGFLQSWHWEGFDQNVLDKVKGIIETDSFERQSLRILVCGHSLGGAIAVLAAHDIARFCNVGPHQVSCYTFGCPRVGNEAFAIEHNKLVPDTWHIINGLDPIPRMAKFWVLYKHTGKRVAVNGYGDLIISPMFLEFKLTSAFMGKRRLVHHRLLSYRKSLSRVAAGQFQHQKGLPGGSAAMLELMTKWDISRVLQVHGKSSGNWMTTLHKVEQKQSHSSGCNP